MSAMLTCPIIHQTTNYSQFDKYAGNRKVLDSHVDMLVESIKKENRLAFHPIVISQDSAIVDGQHRLAAAEKLKTPIFYVITKRDITDKSLIDSQISKQWELTDYLHLHIENKLPEYINFKRILDQHEIKLSVLFSLISRHSREFSKIFKEGGLVIPVPVTNFLDSTADFRKELKSLFCLRQKYLLDKRDFVGAVFRFWKDYHNFWEEGSKKIMSNVVKIPEKFSIAGYVDLFIDWHDWKKDDKNRIKPKPTK